MIKSDKMSSKLIFIVILSIIWHKNNFYQLPFEINILILIFAMLIYYMEKKLIIFCKDKMKALHNSKEHKDSINKEIALIRFPDIKSSYQEDTPFLAACRKGDTQTIQKLLENGADVYKTNIYGEGAMYLATNSLIMNPHSKDARSIWTLYHAGCPINARTNDGFTPLHLAAYYGHCSIIKWLLAKGADPKVYPLASGLALAAGHKRAASMLLFKEHNIQI